MVSDITFTMLSAKDHNNAFDFVKVLCRILLVYSPPNAAITVTSPDMP